MSSKIRIAIIGMGMGRFHLQHYLKSPFAEVVALVDLDAGRLADVHKLAPQSQTFSNHKEMLRAVKPDLVSVALPNVLHESVSVDCLEAGAHVLCEKPMSMNVASALRMRDAAEKAKRQLYINFSQRFSPFSQTARRLVDEGSLGPLYHAYVQWTRRDGMPNFGGWFGQKSASGGGPLIDLGVHRLDLVLWLMGKVKPVTVSGVTHHRIGVPRAKVQGKSFDVEDFATGLVRLDNGASIAFEVSWANYQIRHEEQSLRLQGETGAIEGGPGVHGDYTLHYCHHTAGTHMVSVPVRPGPEITSYEEVARCLASGDAFPSTAQDGIRLQIILDALYESARQGREILVEDFAGPALAYL
ncbi:MAG: Gfo/Idh/MocA family oxidoreductase [Opitutales bacterium]|nr:Gfo/Idh/MocA family oxidoreductase [Opitutales bacterium]